MIFMVRRKTGQNFLVDKNIAELEVKHADIQKDDVVAVMSLKDELIAVGSAQMISKEVISEERGLAVKINKVFMNPGVYPRMD